MKFIIKIANAIIFFLALSPNNIMCQNIIWTYEFSKETDNMTSLFWIDNEGASHVNILEKTEKNKISFSYTHKHLIKVSKEGIYKSTITLKKCTDNAKIFPFGENNYLTYGLSCIGDKNNYYYKYRIFNKNGELIRTGETIPTHAILNLTKNNKTTFFLKNTNYNDYSEIYIGYLNKGLKIEYDTVTIKELKIDGFGMSLSGGSPINIGLSDWVIPIKYGITKNSTLRLSHGGFFVTCKNKIAWKFIPDNKYYLIPEIETHNDKIFALIVKRNRSYKQIKIFDKNGLINNEFLIRVDHNKVYDMKIIDSNIVILSLNYLNYYSFEGEMIKKVALSKMERVTQMEIYDFHSIIIAGVRNGKTLLTKIGI